MSAINTWHDVRYPQRPPVGRERGPALLNPLGRFSTLRELHHISVSRVSPPPAGEPRAFHSNPSGCPFQGNFTYLSAQPWRLTRRIGKKKAAVAVGHFSLAVSPPWNGFHELTGGTGGPKPSW
ncbi:MAG: hypothetical protein ACP5P1_13510 [Acidimicrobiales bacterium]